MEETHVYFGSRISVMKPEYRTRREEETFTAMVSLRSIDATAQFHMTDIPWSDLVELAENITNADAELTLRPKT